MNISWPYRVKGYASTNLGGHLLLETVHDTKASRDMELAVWRTRYNRGGISRVEVIDHVNGTTRSYPPWE